jgi:hypothetical protein
MEPISTASLRCEIVRAEVTMRASPTYRALLNTLEGKAVKRIHWTIAQQNLFFLG